MKYQIKVDYFLIVWLFFLIISFSYEKPVFILTNADRLNPRFFDIVFFSSFLIYPFIKSNPINNPIFKNWKYIVFWSGFILLSSVFIYPFPFSVDLFSFYYYFEFIKGFWVLYVFSKMPSNLINVRFIFRSFLLIGFFLLLYCFDEYYNGVTGEIEYLPGKFAYKPQGVIWGPFGNTYFQIANYLPFCSLIIFGFAFTKAGFFKYILILIAIVLALPLLVVGSRTGVALLLLSFGFFVFYQFRISGLSLFIIVIILLLGFFSDSLIQLKGFSTVNRIISMEDHEFNSSDDRFFNFLEFNIFEYYYNGLLVPFFGGGFYVAPTYGNFRIGYGFHNIYLFAFEQLGFIGFFLFINFILKSLKSLKKSKLLVSSFSNNLILLKVVLSYWIASLLIGFAGHTFWYGFATNNLNTFRILILMLACSSIISFDKK